MTPAPDARPESIRRLHQELAVLSRRVRRAVAVRAAMVHPELRGAGYAMVGELLNGPRRATELATLFALDKGAVSRQVGQLLELGLVERLRDPADGRAQLLVATEEARRAFGAVAAQRWELIDERLQDWPQEDLDRFAELLARYNRSLDGPDEPGSVEREPSGPLD